MLTKAKIYDIGVDDKNTLGVSVLDGDGLHEINFSLPERFIPSTDLIALSMCTLLGQKYDSVEIDLPITDRTKLNIATICQAEVTSARMPLPQSAPPGRNTALNFSGGFDSLAALALMPEDHRLVSLDFGGPFERERKFFERFDTFTITTNFRQLGFAKNHWTFMGLGTILLRDYLEIETYSFGSILEASPWNFRQTSFSNDAQPVFKASGLKQFNPVLGLTEVGTVMVLATFMPELFTDSLKSLAAPKSEKLNRKILLLNIIQEIFNDDFGVSFKQDNTIPQVKFGQSLASDFLVLYIMKKLGRSRAEQLVEGIPAAVDEFIKSRSLEFFAKNNTVFSAAWPLATNQRNSKKLLDSGITPYLESDWKEYRETVKFLATWHSGL